ncbi:MAG: hypothetical protein U5P41_00875 [Gammaproteobacteria bacterium]|nr:hypothetical protein [Gammaproteobacteria bacterium]
MPDESNPADLPDEARPAYEAYLAMSATKNAYFSFMVELDQKQKNGDEITIAENLKLEQLLKEHDEKVAAFNEAMQAMKEMDEAARSRPIRAMGGTTPGPGY